MNSGSLMNVVLSTTLNKQHFRADQQDQANRFSLIGAMMPFPMGAVMALTLAKNAVSSTAPATTTPQLPSLPAPTTPTAPPEPPASNPVTLYVDGQPVSGDQPISFGKRFKTEGAGTKPTLQVKLKNISGPTGPTVKLETDISGTDFRVSEKADERSFRPGDDFECTIELDTTKDVNRYDTVFYIVVNDVERRVPVTGEIVLRPVATITIRTKEWTPSAPQHLQFTTGADATTRNTADIEITNKGEVDYILSLLPGCRPAGYTIKDDKDNDLLPQLGDKGLTIAKGKNVKAVLDGTNAQEGVTSLIFRKGNQSAHFDDLLVALLKKE